MNLQRTTLLSSSISEGAQTGATADPSDHYVGVTLSPGSQKALLRHFPSAHETRHGEHVTLNYTPSQEEVDRIQNMPEHERQVNFHATHHAHEPTMGVHAVRVAGLEHLTQKEHPHITISTAKNVQPVKSNDLLAQQRGERINVPRTGRSGKTRRGHLPLTGRLELKRKW